MMADGGSGFHFVVLDVFWRFWFVQRGHSESDVFVFEWTGGV